MLSQGGLKCRIEGHEENRVAFICAFKDCKSTPGVCYECILELRHWHGNSQYYLLQYEQFTHFIQEQIKNYQQKLDKIEEIKYKIEKQCKYFKQQLESCQLNLNEEKQLLQNVLNVGLSGLSNDQINNIINPDQNKLKWDNIVKDQLKIIIEIIKEIENIVELFKNQTQLIKQSYVKEHEREKNINQSQEQNFMQQYKRDKEIQIKSCINHQILVIKEIDDYVTNKRQELNSWENLIYQIAASLFTLQQEINPIKTINDNNSFIKKILEDHKKQTQRFDQIIIGQEKIDMKQQKEFKLEKQILILINQLDQIKIDLKKKQDEPEEYFQNIEEVVQKNKINQQSDSKLYSQDDKIELFEADQINWKELFEEFQVNQIGEYKQKEISADGNSAFYLIQQGLIQVKLGFYENSSSVFEKVIQQYPSNSRAYHCKANTQAILNQHKLADDLYSIAIKLDPDYESCYLNKLRNLYMDWKQYGKEGDELLIQIKIKFPDCKKIQYIERHQKIRRASSIINGQSDGKV